MFSTTLRGSVAFSIALVAISGGDASCQSRVCPTNENSLLQVRSPVQSKVSPAALTVDCETNPENCSQALSSMEESLDTLHDALNRQCPVGWVQVGEPGADIPGCGLERCGHRYDTPTAQLCALKCDTFEECHGFNFAPVHGDRHHEDRTVCTLYGSTTPRSRWSGSAGFVQIFCVRDNADSTSECAPDVLSKCQGNIPCIDLREGPFSHHLMWLNEDGTAHVDGESRGINAGDHRTWTCARDGDGVGLVGTWNCPGFFNRVITVSADFSDDFTDARDNDFIDVCALPEPAAE